MSTVVRERPQNLLTPPAPAPPATAASLVRAAGARAGLRDMAPVTVAIVPFAMVLGVTINASVVPDLVGAVMTPVLYAGSANFAVVSVLDAGGTALTAAFTALVVNARFTMYGAALAERFRDQPRWFRWLGPSFIIDQTFALSTARTERDPAWFRAYWFAAAGLIGIVFTAMAVVGILLGPIVPSGIGLEFTVPVLFVALSVSHVRDRPALAAAVAGAAVTALALDLPHGLGLLAGAVAGSATGAIARRMS
ncbi:MAG TPA: AzlC family ABC transporter permease [Euzebyales bacterium]|nr:AzlC family ABC transporter permease [Euzebyales bacterium]